MLKVIEHRSGFVIRCVHCNWLLWRHPVFVLLVTLFQWQFYNSACRFYDQWEHNQVENLYIRHRFKHTQCWIWASPPRHWVHSHIIIFINMYAMFLTYNHWFHINYNYKRMYSINMIDAWKSQGDVFNTPPTPEKVRGDVLNTSPR
jgi:hypothetical protein